MARSILIALLAALTTLIVSPCLVSSTNVLYSRSKLLGGERLTYGEHSLVMQPDCNLVLSTAGRPTWQTNTAGKGRDCFVWFDVDGAFIILGVAPGQTRRSLIWTNGVHSGVFAKHALVLKWDGTLHMYSPGIWSRTRDFDFLNTRVPATTDSVLWTGDVAPIGATVFVDDYRLELLESCNLTLTDTKSGSVVWHTNTQHFLRDCYVSVEGNGELKIKYLGGDTLWSNGKGGQWGDYILGLRPDGNLVVYGPSIWAVPEKKAVAMVGEE